MPELSLLTFPIIIFCSMSGHRVISSADVHFYSSTKYAVTALTEGLRQELREANTHIRATVRLLQTYIYKCTFLPDHHQTSASQCFMKFSYI